ncbi:MAG: long-chain fatty acid--CoA ligase [Alphaproteobacteria bacterium]|nr:MAG: long-chain fatty acid--CoA ligase [Alphaproteobacteria bacterium]
MSERPWLKSYPEGVAWDMQFEPTPLPRLLEDAARDFPDNPCLNFLGRRTTYRQLWQQARAAAAGFQELGVKPGTKVGLYLPNCPQYPIAYYGALLAGATIVNYSPLYSERELLAQVEDSETDIMVSLDLEVLYPKMEKVFRETRLKRMVVGSLAEVLPFPKNLLFPLLKSRDIARVNWDESHIRFRDLLKTGREPELVAIDPTEDVAVLQYTGGTTGVPKGAMLTHANLYVNVMQNKAWQSAWELGKERVFAALPFFHVFAMTAVLNLGIATAAELLLMPRYETNEAIRIIEKYGATMMAGVPTMYRALLDHPRAGKGAFAAMKHCVSGGAPLPAELAAEFERVAGCRVVEGYGLTETSPVVTANRLSGEHRPGSIGLPLPATDLLILDKDDPDREMPLGETGELAVRGPQVMKGYWKRPDETEKVLKGDILLTGDLGYMDEDGYTFIVDREKDLILVSGFNVFPRIVEEALYEHPAVAEATVIGVPHEYKGEVPKAFVALKPGHDGLTADELMEFLKPRLARHEMPKEIEFRDSLPKTVVGKLSKKELVAEERAKRTESARSSGIVREGPER